MRLNFQTSDFQRGVADSASLLLKNRYFEQNPSLSEDGASLLSRPGMRKLTTVGEGPIRGMASQPGSFNGDLFIASGAEFYRMDNQLNKVLEYSGLANPQKGVVNMAITGNIGETPEYCFVADGSNLFVYIANGFAQNVFVGTPANNDVVRVGDIYYRYTTGSVDAGAPAGTSANPYLIFLGGTPAISLERFYEALTLEGQVGITFSTNTVKNPMAIATGYGPTFVSIRSPLVGVLGNSTVTTTTSAGASWTNGGTMSGGGAPTFSQVFVPDNVGVIDVAVINSFVIVVPDQIDGFQGRFYWIDPGETTIDPLNFATAERSPDGIYGVQVFGDQFWLPGEGTTEVWYVTGDQDRPMARLQGIVLDRGSWQNTAKAIHETMVVVDADGGVFTVQGGSPKRVSSPGIEEQIRKAIAAQQSFLG